MSLASSYPAGTCRRVLLARLALRARALRPRLAPAPRNGVQ